MEDIIYVLEVVVEGETALDFCFRQPGPHLVVREQQGLVVEPLRPGLHGDGLDGIIGLLAGESLADQGVHHPLGEDDPVGPPDVPEHRLGIDRQLLQDPREAAEHVVQQLGGVGQDDALRRGMGDVAFVPEGHVLAGGGHVAAHDAGAAADVLAADRIALVRHRAGSLLPGAEGLLGLAHLRPLQVAHLEGHLLQGGGDDGERGHIEGMAVALQDLRGDVGGSDAEPLAHVVLDEGRDVGEVAHGAAHLARLDAPGGIAEPVQVALHFLVPEGPFEAEAGDVGVDAVRAADAGRVLELQGALLQHGQQVLQVLLQNGVRLAEQVAVGRIDHVRGREAVVDPLALRAEALADGAREGHHVVTGLLLDLGDAPHVELRAGADLLHVFGRDDAQPAPGLAGKDLDLQVGPELVFFGPDVPHPFAGITLNHAVGSLGMH